MENNIKVALVDDHKLVREGLLHLVKDLGFSVCMDCSNGKEFTDRIERDNPPDVVLMDINMPVMNGNETTRWLKDNLPMVKVLALSMLEREEDIIKMICNGARGYLVKDSDPAVLRKAINVVMKEDYYYSDILTGAMIHKIRKMDDDERNNKGSLKLKAREIDFLKLASTEMTYKQIADKMFVSPRTVDGYRDELFQKLNVTSRIGLVLYAIKNSIVQIN